MDIGQLAERIGVQRGVDYEQARDLIDDVFRAVAVAVHDGDTLTLPGVGRVFVSQDEPIAAETCFAFLDDLDRAGADLLAAASGAAEAAKIRGDEIDHDIAAIRRVIAGAA